MEFSAVEMQRQKLPSSGPQREALRRKGQFWMPAWVAEAMVAYVLNGGSDHIFDPAVGGGAFFRAAKTIASEYERNLMLLGTEIDAGVLEQARESGLSELDLANVQITDFALHPPTGPYRAIVANPPYIRHHRLSSTSKERLRNFGANLLGIPLDGRAGLHIYFLLRALQLLDKEGRLAFIMPADTVEGVFAPMLWSWITQHYRLEGVITFTQEAAPFPGVDTNALVFLIRNTTPDEHFTWVQCQRRYTGLKADALSGFTHTDGAAITVYQRLLSEGLRTGLSRRPMEQVAIGPTLGDFAKALRGIATGANEFFFLTEQKASALNLSGDFLLPAIGRTRDAHGDEITELSMKELAASGRPTLLFSLDGRPKDEFPEAVRKYLQQGEKMGLNKRALISQRRPWYKMEKRRVPPFLFAYLGRRNARFIRNWAGVMPLTSFLCVYPRSEEQDYIDKLWQVLRHPETVANLSLVGKSYGSGAIKVEPRALEKLPLSASALHDAGLQLDPSVHERLASMEINQAAFEITYIA